jgi:hypothetical protein
MNSNKNKAQASLEFVIVMSIMLFVFAIMGFVIYQKYVELSDLRLYLTGRRVANTLADNINQVNIVGEGYSQRFTVYTRHPGDNFNVTFLRDEPVLVVENEMTWYAPLLSTEIYCCLPDICEMGENKTIMRLNSTLTTEVINYNESIYIGMVCS